MRKLLLVVVPILVGLCTCVLLVTLFVRPRPRSYEWATSAIQDRTLYGDHIREILLAGRYDELESIADSLRTAKARWPNGDWMLRHFYSESFDLEGADEATWQRMMGRLRDWAESHPTSITAPVALACGLTRYAWNARGSGYANTVTDEGWELFRQRLGEAYGVLDDASRLPERCPGWYQAMQIIARGVGWERPRYDALLREATSLHPDYPVYYVEAAYRLLPRWYGEPGEWERFAKSATDTLADSLKYEMYARIVWYQSRNFDNVFKESRASWALTKRGFEEMTRRYPDCVELESARLVLATCAGDEAEAALAVARLKGRLDVSVGTRKPLERVVRRYYAKK
jgi:hypothetical protein